jgi:hypothetical protein
MGNWVLANYLFTDNQAGNPVGHAIRQFEAPEWSDEQVQVHSEEVAPFVSCAMFIQYINDSTKLDARCDRNKKKKKRIRKHDCFVFLLKCDSKLSIGESGGIVRHGFVKCDHSSGNAVISYFSPLCFAFFLASAVE